MEVGVCKITAIFNHAIIRGRPGRHEPAPSPTPHRAGQQASAEARICMYNFFFKSAEELFYSEEPNENGLKYLRLCRPNPHHLADNGRVLFWTLFHLHDRWHSGVRLILEPLITGGHTLSLPKQWYRRYRRGEAQMPPIYPAAAKPKATSGKQIGVLLLEGYPWYATLHTYISRLVGKE